MLPSSVNVAEKLSTVNLISIPNRDYGIKQASINSLHSLQVWAVRHKRLRTVSEVSIPNRDYCSPIDCEESFTITKFRFYINLSKKKFIFIKLNSLLILNSYEVCYHHHHVWLQRLSAGTETRWTMIYSSDAHCFLVSSPKPPTKQLNWRFSYMGNHKQLELFDLRLYTSKQPSVLNAREVQVRETRPCVEYKQLELDLFPHKSHENPKHLVRLLA